MKTFRDYRTTFLGFLATGLITCSVLAGCDKDDDDMNNNDDMLTISGNASGAQEIPSNASSATGTLTGSYNKNTNSLTYTINWSGLSNVVSVAHFHGPATTTETASPMVDITLATTAASGSTSATVTISDAAESALLDGKMYYNLHTALYPNGEIRGQVAVTAH